MRCDGELKVKGGFETRPYGTSIYDEKLLGIWATLNHEGHEEIRFLHVLHGEVF